MHHLYSSSNAKLNTITWKQVYIFLSITQSYVLLPYATHNFLGTQQYLKNY